MFEPVWIFVVFEKLKSLRNVHRSLITYIYLILIVLLILLTILFRYMFATLFSNLSRTMIIGLEISNWFTRKPDNSINGTSHWRESGEAKQGWWKGVELKQRERRKKRNCDGLQSKDYIEWNGIVNIVILRHKGGSNRADQATSGGQGNNRGWPLRQPSVAFSLLLLAPPPPPLANPTSSRWVCSCRL